MLRSCLNQKGQSVRLNQAELLCQFDHQAVRRMRAYPGSSVKEPDHFNRFTEAIITRQIPYVRTASKTSNANKYSAGRYRQITLSNEGYFTIFRDIEYGTTTRQWKRQLQSQMALAVAHRK